MSDSQEDSQQPVRQEFGDIVSAVARRAVCALRMFPNSSMTTFDPFKPVPNVQLEFVPAQGIHDRVKELLEVLSEPEVRYDEIGSRLFEHDDELWPQLVTVSRSPGTTAATLLPIVRDFANWIEQRYIGTDFSSINNRSQTEELIRVNDSCNCVLWGTKEFTFLAGPQADCVRIMFTAWKSGLRWIDQKEIIAQAEAYGERLSDKYKNHPAWGTMIVRHPETAGLYGLANPTNES
jgi:hypothetical protein